MSRPRGFTVGDVVVRAKELFWERGYQGTAISDLEVATGLHRSSLYQAFGSKERLFEAALDNYIETFMGPLLSPMRGRDARRGQLEDFYERLGALFRGDEVVSRRGCLWVNTLAEFTATRDAAIAQASAYRSLLSDAFSNALRAEPWPRALVQHRTRMLVATTFGLWLLVRIDAGEAALAADAARAEVHSW